MKNYGKFSRFMRIMAWVLTLVLMVGMVGTEAVKTASAEPSGQITLQPVNYKYTMTVANGEDETFKPAFTAGARFTSLKRNETYYVTCTWYRSYGINADAQELETHTKENVTGVTSVNASDTYEVKGQELNYAMNGSEYFCIFVIYRLKKSYAGSVQREGQVSSAKAKVDYSSEVVFYEKPGEDGVLGTPIASTTTAYRTAVTIPAAVTNREGYDLVAIYDRYSIDGVYYYNAWSSNSPIYGAKELFVEYKEKPKPVVTITKQPIDYPFYNQNNSEYGFAPEFSLNATVENVEYKPGMIFVFNWQEKRSGSNEFVDCPLISGQTSMSKTEPASTFYSNGQWKTITDTLEITSDNTENSGRVIARNGAIFRCNVILRDANGKEICRTTTDEVQVVYEVKVTIHDGNSSEVVRVRYNHAVEIPESLQRTGMTTTLQTRTTRYGRYVYSDYDLSTKITAPVELWVKRVANEATVTFYSVDANGRARHNFPNGIVSAIQVGIGTKIPEDKIPSPTCNQTTNGAKHIFLGWYKDINCTEKFDFTQDITANTPVYSKWGNAYEVVFRGNNLINETVETQYVVSGEKAAEPENITAKGEHEYFLGWYNGNQKYDFDSAVTGPVTLTAKTATYPKVTFKMNGHGGRDVEVYVGSDFKIPSGSVPNPTDANFTFEGWTLNGNPFNTDSVVESNIEVVANWKAKVVYHTVTFVAREDNNETRPRHNFTDYPITVEHGKLIDKSDIPANPTCPAGHIFDGWYTSIDLSTPFNFDTMTITKDIKIYSGWLNMSSETLDAFKAKTDYTEGDALDLTNVKIVRKYTRVSGNTTVKTEEIEVTPAMVTNYNTVTQNAGNNREVEVKYGDKKYTYTINVAKKTQPGSITLTETKITKTYGAEPFAIDYTKATGAVTFVSNDESIAVVDENGKIVIVGVGETTITVKVAANGIYTATTGTVALKTEAKTISLVWDEDTLAFEYDGKSHVPSVTIPEGSLVGDDKCTVSVTVKEGEAKNAGNYTAVATISDTEKYVLEGSTDGSEEKAFAINPKPVSVSWDEDSLATRYNGKQQLPTAEVNAKDLVEGDECILTLGLKRNGKVIPFAEDDCIDAGYYEVGVCSVSNNNYELRKSYSKSYVIYPKFVSAEFSIDIDTLLCGTEIGSRTPIVDIQPEFALRAKADLEAPRLSYTITGLASDYFCDVKLLDADTEHMAENLAPWNGKAFTVKGDKTYKLIVAIANEGDTSNTILNGLTCKATYGGKPVAVESIEYINTLKFAELFDTERYNILTGKTEEQDGLVMNEDDLYEFFYSLVGREDADPDYTAAVQVAYAVITLKAEHVPGEEKEDETKHADSTCLEKGSETFVVECKSCGEVLSSRTETIDALGHEFGNWIMGKEPTVFEDGFEYRKCIHEGCQETEKRVLEKLPAEIKSIEIKIPDDAKKEYTVGDRLDLTGMKVVITMTNNEVTTLDVTEDMVSGFDSSKAYEKLPLVVKYKDAEGGYNVSVKEAEKIVYTVKHEIVNGDQRFVVKSNVHDELTFGKYRYFEIGKVQPPKDAYIAKAGSLDLTIKKSYLDTLQPGVYELHIYFEDGEVVTTLEVEKEEEPEEEKKEEKQNESGKAESPKTADTANTAVWTILLTAAAAMFILVVIYRRKKDEAAE